jgi:glycosyltransferase involved in cell wall biosynthesis
MCRGVVTRPEQLHISYIHHPPRNLYGYPTGKKPNGLVSAYATFINPFLRMYDFATAQRVDYLIANSQETRSRIKKFYRREAKVIYPPVKVGNNSLPPPLKIRGGSASWRRGVMKRSYFLSVGRLTYAKRVDLAIEACNKLKVPLKIVGTGREEESLRKIAGPTIEFVGSVSDEELARLYVGAKALIFCALQEDFGMVPVEAMALGVPVIVLKQGGVIETVTHGKTGLFFEDPTVEDLIKAIKALDKSNVKPEDCVRQAQKFSAEVFKKKMKAFIEEKYRQHNLSSQ